MISFDSLYRPGDALGYGLGMACAISILGALAYSCRKGKPGVAGSARTRLNYHSMIGVAGSVLALFHSTFRWSSILGGIALGSIILLALSGLFGQFGLRYAQRRRQRLWSMARSRWRAFHAYVAALFVVTTLAHIVAVHMY